MVDVTGIGRVLLGHVSYQMPQDWIEPLYSDLQVCAEWPTSTLPAKRISIGQLPLPPLHYTHKN